MYDYILSPVDENVRCLLNVTVSSEGGGVALEKSRSSNKKLMNM